MQGKGGLIGNREKGKQEREAEGNKEDEGENGKRARGAGLCSGSGGDTAPCPKGAPQTILCNSQVLSLHGKHANIRCHCALLTIGQFLLHQAVRRWIWSIAK
jgi:hypothetical protein